METKKDVESIQEIASPEIDYAAEYAKVLTEIQSVTAEKEKALKDKDIYKKGLLGLKGKLPDDETEGSISDLIDKKVEEKLYIKREAELRARESDLVKQALAKNKELALALKNNKISMGTTSSSEGMQSNNDNVLSPEQIAELKSRGWDEKKIAAFKKNLNRNPK